MKLDEFFAGHPMFTIEEIDRFLGSKGSDNLQTRQALLSYHRHQGRIARIRRGLYAVVPPGSRPDIYQFDSFLIASRLTDDAVLAYHTALAFQGVSHSVRRDFVLLSAQPAVQRLVFRGETYRAARAPRSLGEQWQSVGIQIQDRLGLDVRVTSLERTLVDMLDRPSLSGGWEEVWRSLESVEFFDLDRIVGYALLLKNATTAAKVGYFLEENRERLMVDDKYLRRLREVKPRQPHYLARDRGPARLISGWNLIVPTGLSERSWQEVL